MTDPASTLLARWNHASGTRLGRWLFSRAVGRFAPYSGTIAPRIESLEPGRAVIAMNDRKAVRNHLRSIHAAAMMNLVELTGSLAASASLPPGSRMIPVRVDTEFLKKARGTLTADAQCEIPKSPDHGQLPVGVAVTDGDGDEVARARVEVLVGPTG
jgi:acyl-coenzyme A thioesterase PaaI-like protein